ncbi:MAG TPA: LamG-like jellyroll fold domain-containing protein [Ramlibacter sp.]|nr:LamG-like jellyroll fold domain-containing protein [Ramlibacter sp.]
MRCLFASALLLAVAVSSGCGGGSSDADFQEGNSPLAAPASTYWNGVTRALPVSPLGNKLAVSCHNCYGTTNTATTTQVSMALNRGFDLVEFDITRHADGVVYVEHTDSETVRGTFAAALANPGLQQSDLLLFLEIKEGYTTTAASDALMLNVLRAVRDNGYAKAGRPTVLRAFMDGGNRHQHLVRAKTLLAAAEFDSIRSYIRFHTLLESDIRNGIRTTKSLGFHGIELQYQMADMFGAIMQAKLLGLGVGVYTQPASMGELFLSAMREDVDFITTDYDRGATAAATSVRSLVQEATSLMYMNTGKQTAYPLIYQRTNSTDFQVAASSTTPGLEVLSVTSDEDRVGGSMVFTGTQSITTYDGDNLAAGGFLVTAVVNFDDLTSGATGAILAKSDSGGFALEQAGTQLRFGVYVNGAYTYATAPLTAFNGTNSYFIVGAYDGNGAVRLWVDNTERTASASISGGVGVNASPIVIGADPQGATTRRFFFKGKVQQVMVQRWRDH